MKQLLFNIYITIKYVLIAGGAVGIYVAYRVLHLQGKI